MPELHAFFLRKMIKDIKNTKKIDTNVDIQKELSPKSLKEKKHAMNRIQSMDNFMKFSWSWTL